MRRQIKQRLLMAILLLLLVFLTGIIGYHIIGRGQWGLIDSTYMTVITLSTVGFGEVLEGFHDNQNARIFTIFLILFGMGILTFTITNFTAFLVEGELSDVIWRQRMVKKIGQLRDHYIVCGAGTIGFQIIDELIRTKRQFVVIEKDPARVQKLKEMDKNILIIEGDAAEDEILIRAGIDKAHGMACSMGSDQENLFVAVAARFHNSKVRIVAQCSNPEDRPKFLKAGVDSVVSPQFIGALRMASEMFRPHVTTFLDSMLRDKRKEVRIEEVTIYPNSPLSGKKLKDTPIREKTGLMVLALREPDGEDFVYNPTGDEVIPPSGVVVIFGDIEGVEKLRKMAGTPPTGS